MRGYVKSLLAELFPGWLKQEVVQHRLRDPRRGDTLTQGQPHAQPHARNSSFGKRSSYRAGAGAGGAARRPRPRK